MQLPNRIRYLFRLLLMVDQGVSSINRCIVPCQKIVLIISWWNTQCVVIYCMRNAWMTGYHDSKIVPCAGSRSSNKICRLGNKNLASVLMKFMIGLCLAKNKKCPSGKAVIKMNQLIGLANHSQIIISILPCLSSGDQQKETRWLESKAASWARKYKWAKI